MNNLLNILSVYDWGLTFKVLFCILVILFLFLDKILDKHAHFIVVSPFLIMLSYFITTSNNLISLIFFIEVTLFLKEILYGVNVRRFELYYFRLVRLPLWLFVIYCHFLTFSTFNLASIVEKADSSLTISFFSVLLIISTFVIGFLYRKRYFLESKIEKITTVSIIFPVIVLKLIGILASWSDLLQPHHKSYIFNVIVVICVIALFLTIRYITVKNKDEIFLGFSSMVCLTLLPLLIYPNTNFWGDFSHTTFKIIGLLVITHTFYISTVNTRFSQVLTLALSCQVLGISPFGHLSRYFSHPIQSNDQVLSIFALLMCLIGFGFVFMAMINSLQKDS